MSRKGIAYISLVITAGTAILGFSLFDWHTQDWARYLAYCAIALVASGMKVKLPSVMGTMSMNFLFVLIGIAELSLPETLVMGCLGMLVQCVYFARTRLKAVQVSFSVASMACSIAASYSVCHTPLVKALDAPMMLLLGASTFFVTNTFSIAVVIAVTESKNAWTVWREAYFWTFPNYLVGAGVAWTIHETSQHFGWQASLLMLPILYVIYRSHRQYVDRLQAEKNRAEEARIHAEEVAALHRRTIKTLALAIEAKDQTTSDHLARVEVYAIEVGKELGMSNSELDALRASALLHDIGKLAVPEYIISKPGKLTPDEFEKMKTHTVVGGEILEQVRFPYDVAPIVRSHHEKWDGSGYPDGLSGERIPLGARILSAVDCLDALASDRQYRRALPLNEAIQIIRDEAGKSFDARVVEVLSRRYVELEKMASVVAKAEKAKLSTDLKIERGAAPAAGFEAHKASQDLVNFQKSITETESRSRVLNELTQSLEACKDRAEVFETAREALRGLIPYELMALYAREGEHLIPEYLDGEDYRLFASLEIPLGMGLSGWVAENGKSIINGNPSVEPGYLNDPTKFSLLRSALAVPLESGGGVTAVLSLYARESNAFTKEHLQLLTSFGARLASALDANARFMQDAAAPR
ncbi:MAG TPA: HD domain-containing phosphohydrolase [Bryobacteraceae bacterium]|nr:HD domain-containing phosphohydrolase [Bryobacteraceae bacterium]